MIHCQSLDYISYRGVWAELSPSRRRMHPPGRAGSPTPHTKIFVVQHQHGQLTLQNVTSMFLVTVWVWLKPLIWSEGKVRQAESKFRQTWYSLEIVWFPSSDFLFRNLVTESSAAPFQHLEMWYTWSAAISKSFRAFLPDIWYWQNQLWKFSSFRKYFNWSCPETPDHDCLSSPRPVLDHPRLHLHPLLRLGDLADVTNLAPDIVTCCQSWLLSSHLIEATSDCTMTLASGTTCHSHYMLRSSGGWSSNLSEHLRDVLRNSEHSPGLSQPGEVEVPGEEQEGPRQDAQRGGRDERVDQAELQAHWLLALVLRLFTFPSLLGLQIPLQVYISGKSNFYMLLEGWRKQQVLRVNQC